MPLPVINIKKEHSLRLETGSPWVFSNEIANFADLKTISCGSLVQINLANKPFALGYFNHKTLISARILSKNVAQKIDVSFFVNKIQQALSLRQKFYQHPNYRLIHSEADGLPGLIVDRFANIFVCQISTAGMQNLQTIFIEAMQIIFANCNLIFKNNQENRSLEGLEVQHNQDSSDKLTNQLVEVQENNLFFTVDLVNSQKTGWFFDQQPSRKFVAEISKNQKVLDAYCFVGGFGVNAFAGGASEVLFIDSSKHALDLAKQNCQKLLGNNYQEKAKFYQGQVFDLLSSSQFTEQKFDIILLDPPPFIQNKKHLFAGLRGYEKLAKMAIPLLNNGGILMLASCSHHASKEQLINSVNMALQKSHKTGRLIASFTAGPDHPLHPALKESEYLKSLFFVIN